MSAVPRAATTHDLEVVYLQDGPDNGTPVFLYHGFPDDAQTWDAVASALAAAGFRTMAPYVRGFGPTRFRNGVPRTGEIPAQVHDVVALADTLGIDRFHLVGHDWGARAAYGAAALWPERVIAVCGLANPYGTTNAQQILPIEQTRAYWYQWYFATPRGEDELVRNRRAFCRELWRAWAPDWSFDEAEYETTALSFENPDFVTVVLSSYRERWGFVRGVDVFDEERRGLAALPAIRVPTLTLLGAEDGATLPGSARGKERLFAGPYRVETLSGCGHFLQRERAADVAERVLAHLRAYDSE